MTEGRKAIFLDIDGTLSWHGAAPCDDDIAALRRARAAGHLVLINTGRSRGILPETLVDVDYLDGYLCGCGTQLLLHGEEVFGGTLDRTLLRQVAAFYLNAPGRCCLFEAERGAYLLQCQTDFDPWPTAPRVTAPDDFDTRFTDARITKLTLYGSITPAERALYAGRLEPVLQSSGKWFEAILPGRGKGLGLRRVCRQMGIAVENSIAIGDSDNDLDMFAHAGMAVAMAEASPAAMVAARYRTGRCGEGGVARAVNALVFGEGCLDKTEKEIEGEDDKGLRGP